jgi:membrane protease YdiL (CAAX protease family)
MEEQFQSDDIVRRHKEPTILESNFLYLSVLLGMLVIGGIISGIADPERIETLTLLLILALLTAVVIGLPILIFVIRGNIDYKAVFRLYPVETDELILVAGLAFLGYPAVIGLNIIWHWLISHIGPPIIIPLPHITSITEYLMAIIAIGVLPSVFEELMFRGIMLRSYERLGKFASIAITGIMFGFLHRSFAGFPALILLGIVLGYVVYRSDSVYTGMLYHFIHNSIVVTFMFLANLAQQYMENAAIDAQQMNDEQMMFIGRLVWIVLGALSAGGFTACLIAYGRKTKNKRFQHVVNVTRPKRLLIQMMPALGGGIIIIILLALEVFAMFASR